MSVIGNPGIVSDNLVFYYDANNIKSYVGQPTTNTIPSPSINAYPTYGNGWGSYNTNQYGNGNFFSIGTVSSVSNNIVTMSANHSLRSYDVMRPQTTGGGVTANTDYLIKKLSDTTFSLHSYNSSQDGSQGYISSATNTHKVYDDFANDVRVSINSTSFPTMWWGAPHLPNSGLVKEIIPNGFDVNPLAKTNCIRLHYIRTDGVIDGMSYNVDATVTPGSSNTHSFWTRAVTPDAVGKGVGMSIYNYGANPYQYYGLNFTLGPLMVWQRQTYSFTPVNANIITYWFGGASPPYKWDLANIQVEANSNATNFVAGSRSNIQGLLDLTGTSTISLANAGFDSSSNITFNGSSNYINVANNSSLTPTSNMTWEFVVNPGAIATYKSIFSKNNYGNSTGFICLHTGSGSLRLEASDVAQSTRGLDVSFSGILTLNTNVHCALTYNGSTFTLYKNGVSVGTATWSYGLGSNNVADFNIGTGWPGYWNGKIHLFKIYSKALSASEVLKNFNSLKSRYGL